MTRCSEGDAEEHLSVGLVAVVLRRREVRMRGGWEVDGRVEVSGCTVLVDEVRRGQRKMARRRQASRGGITEEGRSAEILERV